MSEAENLKVVQDGYAAFARGDVQTILNALADDVVWHSVYGAGSHVPEAGERHGKAAVAEFFKILSETFKFKQFDVRDFVASGNKVVALGHFAGTSDAGGAVDSDFASVFTMREGKIARFQDFNDSSQMNAAFAK